MGRQQAFDRLHGQRLERPERRVFKLKAVFPQKQFEAGGHHQPAAAVAPVVTLARSAVSPLLSDVYEIAVHGSDATSPVK